jgi:hypothetical protein
MGATVLSSDATVILTAGYFLTDNYQAEFVFQSLIGTAINVIATGGGASWLQARGIQQAAERGVSAGVSQQETNRFALEYETTEVEFHDGVPFKY